MRCPIKPTANTFLWIGAYFALIAAPLIALFAGGTPQGGGFWWDFSMALGFAGMAMMGMQFVLTARFPNATEPFGIDIIYYFHRYLAVLAFGAVVVHAVVALWRQSGMLAWLDPRAAPWYMTAGIAAFALFLVIIATSIWRKQIRLEYDLWRIAHAILATVAFALALLHIEGVGYFINDPIQRTLWTGLTLSWVALIAYVRLIRPWRLMRAPYRVTEVRREAGRVWTLVIEPRAHREFSFVPGQFAWLSVNTSPFRMREHPFSISSIPAAGGRLVFTIKELGDFTRTIGSTRVGTDVYVDGPYGTFTADLAAKSSGLGFIAGGVGIAPIVGILRGLAVDGERRPVTLFFCNRIFDHILFRDELDALASRLNLRIVHVLSEPPADWSGERGFISDEILKRHLPPGLTDFSYFVCGPNPMIRLTERNLNSLGVPLRRIHSEIFDLA